jgi:hypothetical protein
VLEWCCAMAGEIAHASAKDARTQSRRFNGHLPFSGIGVSSGLRWGLKTMMPLTDTIHSPALPQNAALFSRYNGETPGAPGLGAQT